MRALWGGQAGEFTRVFKAMMLTLGGHSEDWRTSAF